MTGRYAADGTNRIRIDESPYISGKRAAAFMVVLTLMVAAVSVVVVAATAAAGGALAVRIACVSLAVAIGLGVGGVVANRKVAALRRVEHPAPRRIPPASAVAAASVGVALARLINSPLFVAVVLAGLMSSFAVIGIVNTIARWRIRPTALRRRGGRHR